MQLGISSHYSLGCDCVPPGQLAATQVDLCSKYRAAAPRNGPLVPGLQTDRCYGICRSPFLAPEPHRACRRPPIHGGSQSWRRRAAHETHRRRLSIRTPPIRTEGERPRPGGRTERTGRCPTICCCLLYTSDAADDLLCVDLG